MSKYTDYGFTRFGEDCYIAVDEEALEQGIVRPNTGYLTFTAAVTDAILENAPALEGELADDPSDGPALVNGRLTLAFRNADAVNSWFAGLAAELYDHSEEGDGQELYVDPNCACVGIAITDDDLVCFVDFCERLLTAVAEAREAGKNTLTNLLVHTQLVHDEDAAWNEWRDTASGKTVDMAWLEGITRFLGVNVAGLVPEGIIAQYESAHDVVEG